LNEDDAPCVVLIEDDPLVRLGQEMLLRDWGYRVVTGASRDEVFSA
jgi:CheY-like chemotaxis protein